VRRLRRHGPGEGHPLHSGQSPRQQPVGFILDDFGRLAVGRAAVRRIVLKAPVRRRIVGGGDHDSIGEAGAPAAIMGQDGVRDHRGGQIAAPPLDDELDTVGRHHLHSRDKGRLGQGVGVHAQKERPVDALPQAVVTNRLADGEQMLLVEGPLTGNAAVTRGAETDPLPGLSRIGVVGVIGGNQSGDIDQQVARSRFSGQRMNAHMRLPQTFKSWRD